MKKPGLERPLRSWSLYSNLTLRVNVKQWHRRDDLLSYRLLQGQARIWIFPVLLFPGSAQRSGHTQHSTRAQWVTLSQQPSHRHTATSQALLPPEWSCPLVAFFLLLPFMTFFFFCALILDILQVLLSCFMFSLDNSFHCCDRNYHPYATKCMSLNLFFGLWICMARLLLNCLHTEMSISLSKSTLNSLHQTFYTFYLCSWSQ